MSDLQNNSKYDQNDFRIVTELGLAPKSHCHWKGGRLVTIVFPHGFKAKTVDLTQCSELQKVSIKGNAAIGLLDLSKLPKLKEAALGSDQRFHAIDELRIVDCAALQSLSCYSLRDLKSLDLTGCANLQKLHFYACHTLTSLDPTPCANLYSLHFSWCRELGSLDLTGCTDLRILRLYGCANIVSLNLTRCRNLRVFDRINCPNLTIVRDRP